MKAKFLVALACASSITSFAADYNDNPIALHDLSSVGPQKTMQITFKIADNPMKVCNAESKRVGNGGFGYAVGACSFWTKDTCTVVLPRSGSMHTIGHEVMHCLKGDWHPQ